MPRPRLTRRQARALVRDVVEAFGENRLLSYASAVAFRTFVALIPLTLLGIALLGATGEQKIPPRTTGRAPGSWPRSSSSRPTPTSRRSSSSWARS